MYEARGRNSQEALQALERSLTIATRRRLFLALPQAFVGLFKPLFPKAVQERLKFEKAAYLSSLNELTPLTTDKASLTKFLNEVKQIVG